MVVEALLIVSVASLNLPVVPRRSGTNELMFDLVTSAEHVKRVSAFSFGKMGEFCTVIRLNGRWSIAKEDNCAPYKVYGGIAAIFLVGVNKALS